MNYELLNIERIVDCVYRENLKVLIYGGIKVHTSLKCLKSLE